MKFNPLKGGEPCDSHFSLSGPLCSPLKISRRFFTCSPTRLQAERLVLEQQYRMELLHNQHQHSHIHSHLHLHQPNHPAVAAASATPHPQAPPSLPTPSDPAAAAAMLNPYAMMSLQAQQAAMASGLDPVYAAGTIYYKRTPQFKV